MGSQEREQDVQTGQGNVQKFLAKKSWSNLLTHTQAEIDQCLKEIDTTMELPEATMEVCIFTINKNK